MISTHKICIEGEEFTWKPLLVASGRFVLLLIAVQVLRAVLYQALLRGLTLAGAERTDIFWSGISAAAFLLVGLFLWIAFRPKVTQLGLDWLGASHREKILTLAGGFLLVGLAGVNIATNPAQLIPTLDSCMVVPLFEELLFRGWGWGKIETTLPRCWRGWGALILVTVIFGLWHLGYADVVSLRTAAHPEFSAPLGWVMAMKVIIGAGVGLLAGLARWRTGHVYGSIIIHAMWNLFGR